MNGEKRIAELPVHAVCDTCSISPCQTAPPGTHTFHRKSGKYSPAFSLTSLWNDTAPSVDKQARATATLLIALIEPRVKLNRPLHERLDVRQRRARNLPLDEVSTNKTGRAAPGTWAAQPTLVVARSADRRSRRASCHAMARLSFRGIALPWGSTQQPEPFRFCTHDESRQGLSGEEPLWRADSPIAPWG